MFLQLYFVTLTMKLWNANQSAHNILIYGPILKIENSTKKVEMRMILNRSRINSPSSEAYYTAI